MNGWWFVSTDRETKSAKVEKQNIVLENCIIFSLEKMHLLYDPCESIIKIKGSRKVLEWWAKSVFIKILSRLTRALFLINGHCLTNTLIKEILKWMSSNYHHQLDATDHFIHQCSLMPGSILSHISTGSQIFQCFKLTSEQIHRLVHRLQKCKVKLELIYK